MANIQKIKRSKVTVEFDAPLAGEYELKYTMESFAEMEEEYGSVQEALGQTKTGKMKPIIHMLWAGLLYADGEEKITKAQVARSIDVRDLEYYMGKVAEAMAGDMPEGNNPN